jgi:CDP-6-deoxy-D-xylo-4-hexulose-3-dehydrase
MNVIKVPYAGRIYNQREQENLAEAIQDFWLTHGKFCNRFEKQLAAILNIKHCALVNSGSSANLLAFMALTQPELGEKAIKRGDEVITVACCFPTTIAPIIQFGAIPVFVDITIPEYNIDVTLLEQALSNRTKAVMIAHTLGNPFNIKAVKTFCDKHNLWLVEDNCDSLGSKYNGQYTGTFGDIGTSSFYPAHHITTGEGGALYTNNDTLYKIILSLRDWGRDCTCQSGHDNACGHRFDNQYNYDHKYIYSRLGYNLKATEFQGAIGCAQLEKLYDFVKARKENWLYYHRQLNKFRDKFILPEAEFLSYPSWFGFILTVKLDAGFTRNQIVKHLEDNGIQTRPLFAGNILKHPCMVGVNKRFIGNFENSDYVMNNTFWIGVYPGLTQEQKEYVVKIISTFLEQTKN